MWFDFFWVLLTMLSADPMLCHTSAVRAAKGRKTHAMHSVSCPLLHRNGVSKRCSCCMSCDRDHWNKAQVFCV